MNEIKNIIFDFGGVLVDWNPEYLYHQLFDNKQEMEFFLTRICNAEWNMLQDAGRSLKKATEELLKKYPDYDEMIRMYYDNWEVMLKGEIHHNSMLINPLKELNYRLFGLTNWSAETFPIAYHRFSFFKEFEGIVVSGIEKTVKPDKKIFRILLNRYQIHPEDSLFIDDNINNIKTADELGFRTIHVIENMNLKNSLEAMNIL
jgi:2-haloacid dehalogenase